MNLTSILTLLSFLFTTQATAQVGSLGNCPKVNLTVSLEKYTFYNKEDILIKMVLMNNTQTNQKLLFDKPKSSTGGPAYTSVSLIDIRTKKSVLKYANKRILESQIYSKEQLKDEYALLKPKQTLQGQYSLFDLAVPNFDNYKLEKGDYEIQVFYCNSRSNVLIFTIK